MTFQRDLAWEGIEALQRSSVAYQFARYAVGLKFGLLPDNVVHQAKRILLDAIACNIGGYIAPGRPICEDVVRELGGKEEATVVGSGFRTTALNATLVNSFMTRFPECNDGGGGGGHNNETVPAILAVGERQKSSGQDVITSIVTSYELGNRAKTSFKGTPLGKRGWNGDTRGCLSMPPSLGRLMGLNEEQIANAIGCVACGSTLLQIIDADREELTMRKNLRMGTISYVSLLYCLLAKKGFTGPVRVVEGEDGWQDVIGHGDIDLEKLVDFSGWRILKNRHKSFWTAGQVHGHLMCTLALVAENDLKAEDVESINITVNEYSGRHNSSLVRKYARNAETADHSTYLLTAIAIIDRKVGRNTVDTSKYTDPVVLDLIERITINVDKNFDYEARGGITGIRTRDGRVLRKQIVKAHGYDENNLVTDEQLENKFRDIAGYHLKKDRVQQIIDTVWEADKLDDIGALMKLTVF